jgi:two-component system nitrate/nitrite sensor histidine kinase NarX
MARRQLRIVHDGEPSPAGRADAPAPPGPPYPLDNPGLGAMLERGLRAIVTLTGAGGGAVRLLAPDGRSMCLLGAVGLSPAALLEERTVPFDCGICGVALRAGGTQIEPGPLACARRLGCRVDDAGCGSVLAVPLHCAGKAIGVFNLFFDDSSRMPADLSELIEPTAQMLDLILENASLENERLRASLVAERQMLAGEVHDSLAQGLAYMRMRMPLLHDAIRGGERRHALKYYDDVNGAMGEAHARLRELITQFRHGIDQGLLQALESTAHTFEDRTGVKLTIESRTPDLRLPPDQETQVYQIVQEALANVVKHAGASSARIVIERTTRSLKISVEDDGCGVARRSRADAARGEHYGLDIMRERAERIGATLEIRSTPGRGTRVRLVLPARTRATTAPTP